MRGPPRVVMILPRIRTGLDRSENVTAVLIGQRSPRAREIRVERHLRLIGLVPIAPRGIRLPHFNQRAPHWPAILIDHPPMHHDSFTKRLCRVMRG